MPHYIYTVNYSMAISPNYPRIRYGCYGLDIAVFRYSFQNNRIIQGSDFLGYIFPLTTIISNGTYTRTTKPLIYEFPQITNKRLRGRRFIRIGLKDINPEEFGFSKQLEGDTFDGFELLIRTASHSDLNNLLNDLRQIFVSQDQATYTEIRLQKTETYFGRGGYVIGKSEVVCYKTGKGI